jgi:uncharacterized protein
MPYCASVKKLAELQSQREAILEIAHRHGAFNVAIFGSVARGEETSQSDIDFLVDFLPGSSLLNSVRLQHDLEKYLLSSVDLLTRSALKDRDQEIRADQVLL